MFEREREREEEKEKEREQNKNIKKIPELGQVGVRRFIGTKRREAAETLYIEELEKQRKRESRNTIGKYEITPEIGKGIQLIFNN